MKNIPLVSRLIVLCLSGLALLAPLAARADKPQLFQDYVPLSQPQPTSNGKRVEVIEFFWYGCPHCFHLEPALNQWLKKLPKDVAFRRVPALANPGWLPLAKAYYALAALNLLPKLNDKLFDAIHVTHEVTGEASLFDWVARQGVSRRQFVEAYRSFTVQNEVLHAKEMTQAYGIDGVPTLVVDGKYATSPAMTGSYPRLFATLDYLIGISRQARLAGKH